MAADGLSKRARIKVVADDDDKFPTSVHKVLSNDDLLTEILLRLPTLSLHLFKPVCKQWLSLITSIDLSGLIINYGDGRWGLEYGYYNFVSFDPRFAAKKRIIFSFNSMARIMQSCNGLLMFYIDGIGEYGIYNPLIDRFKMLPPIYYLPRLKYLDDNMKMAFDPTKSPCYKVVHVGHEGLYSIRIQTYSSETGVWSVCDRQFHCESFKGFCHGIYWNGAIHWLNFPNSLVKLDIVDRPVLTYIETPLPPLAIKAQWYSDCRLLKSHDSLLLLCKDDNHSGYYIYEMKNGYYAWLVKYFVNLDDIMSPYPTWRTSIYLDCRDMFSIVLGEQDEDSFMVINLSEKIIQYKFASKTVIGLFDPGKAVIRRSEGIEYIA